MLPKKQKEQKEHREIQKLCTEREAKVPPLSASLSSVFEFGAATASRHAIEATGVLPRNSKKAAAHRE